MSGRSFTVVAKWDAKAGVFYSESDIIGLHIEATTLDEFRAVLARVAPELIVDNHLSKPELARGSVKDLIPTILLRTSGTNLAVA